MRNLKYISWFLALDLIAIENAKKLIPIIEFVKSFILLIEQVGTKSVVQIANL